MRMRKKKHLEERLEQVADILYTVDRDDRDFRTAAQQKNYLDLDAWFGAKRPLYLEIGCGKGKFAVEYAAAHPEINLLAVEKNSNVIVKACEIAQNAGVKNLRFLKGGAEYLESYLKPQSVSRIFLNFSCPFPKKSYAGHRLTHLSFLQIYRRLMTADARIEQKTDNMHFFEFSIEQFTQGNFELRNVSLDLHHSDFEENIETEYEQRFLALGQPIYRLEAYLK